MTTVLDELYQEMKSAFDTYFDKLKALYRRELGTTLTAPFDCSQNKDLFTSEPDEDGEAAWAPREQRRFDWSDHEKEWGRHIPSEMKAYLNTYYFLGLSGSIGNIDLYFDKIDGSMCIDDLQNKMIEVFHNTAQTTYKHYIIGTAVVGGDDSFTIVYDNDTHNVSCISTEARMLRRIILPYSLTGIIRNMSPIL